MHARCKFLLIAALAIILATASAAVGASLTNHSAQQMAKAMVDIKPIAVKPVEKAVAEATDPAMTKLLAEPARKE